MQIEYTNKKVAELDWKEVEELVAPLHKSGAKHYTKIANHPTKDLWAIPVVLILAYKDVVEDWVNKKGLKLLNRTSDWFPKNDII